MSRKTKKKTVKSKASKVVPILLYTSKTRKINLNSDQHTRSVRWSSSYRKAGDDLPVLLNSRDLCPRGLAGCFPCELVDLLK
jgi:hypothetical protein